MIRFFSLLLILFHTVMDAQEGIWIEAENGRLVGVDTSSAVPGFSGDGYVAGLDSVGDYLELDFSLTSSGIFKAELNYRCTSRPNSVTDLYIDGQFLSMVYSAQTAVFQSVNIGTLELGEGNHTLRLLFRDAQLEPDFVRLIPIDDLLPVVLGQTIQRIEAEDGILFGTRVEFARTGFSGNGYVTNFDLPEDDRIEIRVITEESAPYNMVIGFSSPFGYKENYLRINGGDLRAIAFEENIQFVEVDVGQIALPAGQSTIEIIHFWGYFDLDYIQFKRIVGQPPQSVSSGNILMHDLNGDGRELVALDGSLSFDPDGDIVETAWYASDTLLTTGAKSEIELAVGTHFIDLRVTDDDGNHDRSEVVVIITEQGNIDHDRISIRNGQADLFMSGINVAWSASSNYAGDLNNYQQSRWIKIFDDIQASGGNAVRWWLHTNGIQSPEFGSDGRVSGLAPETIPIMHSVLDLALARGIMVSLCLWSFDMLQEQGQDLAVTRAVLEDSLSTAAYLENALIPMVESLIDHPAIMTWEIFNEAEGMTWEFGWSDERTSMLAVQRFVNRCAGAIHRTGTHVPVSTGIWTLRQASDSCSFFNYYRDDRLISAGGDPDGTLDLVQIHYYDPVRPDASPFHYPTSKWGIGKPIIIGEFPANGIEGFTVKECYDFAYHLGYAGAMSWSYSDRTFGGLPASVPGISHLFHSYPEDILVPDTSVLVWMSNANDFLEVSVYPNPAMDHIWIEFEGNWAQAFYSFELFSIDGSKVKEGLIFSDQQNILSTNILSPGTYILHIHTNKFTFNKLLTKL